MEELNLFPETVSENTKVLFINVGETESIYALQTISKLRLDGIVSELYPDAYKMSKQIGYADKRNIPFVVLAGKIEIEFKKYTLKNMNNGEQQTLTFEELKNRLS